MHEILNIMIVFVKDNRLVGHDERSLNVWYNLKKSKLQPKSVMCFIIYTVRSRSACYNYTVDQCLCLTVTV